MVPAAPSSIFVEPTVKAADSWSGHPIAEKLFDVAAKDTMPATLGFAAGSAAYLAYQFTQLLAEAAAVGAYVAPSLEMAELGAPLLAL